MYGSFSLASFVGVALAVALVVALFFLASPLFAIVILVFAAIAVIPVMSAMRRRSRAEEDRHLREREAPETPEGKPTSPTGQRSTGAPVSGEGST